MQCHTGSQQPPCSCMCRTWARGRNSLWRQKVHPGCTGWWGHGADLSFPGIKRCWSWKLRETEALALRRLTGPGQQILQSVKQRFSELLLWIWIAWTPLSVPYVHPECVALRSKENIGYISNKQNEEINNAFFHFSMWSEVLKGKKSCSFLVT